MTENDKEAILNWMEIKEEEVCKWSDMYHYIEHFPVSSEERENRYVEENNNLKGELESVYIQLDELKSCKSEMENRLMAQIKYLNGMIEGMKFAIRCNGVSGHEVD